MGNENRFQCPVLNVPCIAQKCAWWGKKEHNCAVRIIARLQNFEIDPLEAVLMGSSDSEKKADDRK